RWVVVQRQSEQEVAAKDVMMGGIAEVDVINAESSVRGSIRELRERADLRRHGAAQEHTHLIGKCGRIILRPWRRLRDMRKRRDQHRRDPWNGRELQRLASGRVAR